MIGTFGAAGWSDFRVPTDAAPLKLIKPDNFYAERVDFRVPTDAAPLKPAAPYVPARILSISASQQTRPH